MLPNAPRSRSVLRTALSFLATLLAFAALQAESEPPETPRDPESRPRSGSQLHADELFARGRVIEVEIKIASHDWDTLRSQSRDIASAIRPELGERPFTYFRGDITIEGVRIEGVGVRKKGFIGSLDEFRPSLKIKFDEYSEQSPIEGLSRLTLNNNKQDDSLSSQYLAYKIFADAGVPAPRCNFAHVTVNGESLGIYSNVEAVKKPLLERHFGDGTGRLYEGTVADFVASCSQRFEAKNSAAEENRDVLSKLSELLVDQDSPDLEAIGEIVDVDAFLRYWAVESLIAFWDGYTSNQNNFFIYENPKDSKLHWIPWGADSVFTVAPAILMLPFSPASVTVNGRLPFVLFRNESMQSRYREALEKVLEKAWKEKELLETLDALPKLVGDRLHPHQKGSFEKALARNRRFLERRRERIVEELASWPPEVPSRSRTPTLVKEVGAAKGTFKTKWFEERPVDPTGTGEAKLEFVLNNKMIELESVSAQSFVGDPPPGMKLPPGELPPPTIVLVANRKGRKKTIIVGLSISRLRFKPTKPTSMPVQGFALERGGFFGGSFFFANGTVQLTEASEKSEAPVVGSFDLKLFRFDRR